MTNRLITGFAALFLSVSGCATAKPAAPPPVAPPAAAVKASETQHEAVAKATIANEGGGLKFSDDILRACPGVRSPKFGFDSDVLRAGWADALSTLATCLKTGGLKDSSILLTGHTDPRGTEDYNMALGSRRAGSVSEAIVEFGIAPSRMSTTSRGESEAGGTDEASWLQDRRVDISLQRPVAAR